MKKHRGLKALAVALVSVALSTTTLPAHAWTPGGACGAYILSTKPNYRVTLEPYDNMYYYYTWDGAYAYLTKGYKYGHIHKRVGTYDATGKCVIWWQWKLTINNSQGA